MGGSSAGEGQVAADLMLRNPKTLPVDAPVSEVRAMLENPSVQMVLPEPDTIAPDEPASTAFVRAAASPHRRIVVLGADATLLGLLCLNESGTRFCGVPGSGTVGG